MIKEEKPIHIGKRSVGYATSYPINLLMQLHCKSPAQRTLNHGLEALVWIYIDTQAPVMGGTLIEYNKMVRVKNSITFLRLPPDQHFLTLI